MMGLSLRSLGALLALVGVVLGLLALYSALKMAFGAPVALAGTSAVTLVLAAALWALAALLEGRRKRSALDQITALLADHPVAGLGGAVLIGALTRLGLDVDQMTQLLKLFLNRPRGAKRAPKDQPRKTQNRRTPQ
jgi:hypothetical protein